MHHIVIPIDCHPGSHLVYSHIKFKRDKILTILKTFSDQHFQYSSIAIESDTTGEIATLKLCRTVARFVALSLSLSPVVSHCRGRDSDSAKCSIMSATISICDVAFMRKNVNVQRYISD